MEIYLLSLSLAAFISYIGIFILNYGIPKSISETYYKLKGNKQALFTLALWTMAIPVSIAATTGLLFFAGAFICFTGAAPAFKNRGLERKVHFIGAYVGFALGLLSLCIDYSLYWLVAACVLIVTNIIGRVKSYIFWVEVIVYITIIIGLFYSYL